MCALLRCMSMCLCVFADFVLMFRFQLLFSNILQAAPGKKPRKRQKVITRCYLRLFSRYKRRCSRARVQSLPLFGLPGSSLRCTIFVWYFTTQCCTHIESPVTVFGPEERQGSARKQATDWRISGLGWGRWRSGCRNH